MNTGFGRQRLLNAALLGISAMTLAMSIALGPGRAEQQAVEVSSQSQVRRLTEAQYRRAIADVFGPDIAITGRFEPDLRVEGLLAVGTSAISVTPAGLEQYEETARAVAAQVTDVAHRDRLVGCGPQANDQEGARCAEAFFRRVGLRLYRRPLRDGEVKSFASATLDAGRRLGDFHAGLAAALAGMLTSPDFLFRIDLPDTSGNEVDGYSKAGRLSFLLWDAAPDDVLLEAAANGELDTPEGRAAHVDRLMASARFTDGVRAFFTDYLALDDIDRLSKDTLIFPAFTASVAGEAREQTLRTIIHLLVEQTGDYRDLFTTRRIAMNRALGPLYDIPVAKKGWYIHEFPAGDPRAGLLTQVSLLALHSHPGRTSPTLRGKALAETFLCKKIPSPPANVNFAVVQDVNNPTLKTTRARLQAHLDDEECASCHKLTDPIGLSLEQFDGAGTFRTIENGEPIDASATFEQTAFTGAAELGQRFHDSPNVSDCLVRSIWRYAHGRNPGEGDATDITAIASRFANKGYRVTALIRDIALDRAFYAMPHTSSRRSRTVAASAPISGEGL